MPRSLLSRIVTYEAGMPSSGRAGGWSSSARRAGLPEAYGFGFTRFGRMKLSW